MTSPQAAIETPLAQEHPRPLTGPLTPPKPARPYQTLPHVAISDVTGLIERVHASGDRADLYQLGRDLQLEVDELLPLVDAADLLNLADPQEGDLVLTEIGKRFAEADVLEERYLFQLQARFSEDEARAQLDTVIDWGRYAELFSYVEERGVFRLEALETQEEA